MTSMRIEKKCENYDVKTARGIVRAQNGLSNVLNGLSNKTWKMSRRNKGRRTLK